MKIFNSQDYNEKSTPAAPQASLKEIYAKDSGVYSFNSVSEEKLLTNTDIIHSLILTGVDYNLYTFGDIDIVKDVYNNLHISFVDVDSGDLYYARSLNNGKTWLTELIVDGSVYPNQNPSICVSSDGDINIVFVSTHAGSTTYTQLRYIKKHVAIWESIQNITTNNFYRRYPSICIDGNDDLHVVFNDQEGRGGYYNQSYVKCSGGVWGSIEYITNRSEHETYPSLFIDSSNNPHVVWSEITASFNVYYSKKTASWNTITLNGAAVGLNDPSCVVDNSDNVHVFWNDNNDIVYRKYNGTSWEAETVISSGYSSFEVVACFIDGEPSVLVRGKSDDSPIYAGIYLLRFNGVSWDNILLYADDANHTGSGRIVKNNDKIQMIYNTKMVAGDLYYYSNSI